MHFLMAGYVFDEDIEQSIQELSNVTFLGRVAYNEALLLPFRADVMFTFYDPSSEINRLAASNKWFDAMMAGRPILVNSELSKAPWIEREDIGYLCPYGNAEDLSNRLSWIRNHPDEAMRKGQNGRSLYVEGLSWSVMEKRIYSTIDAVGGGGRA